MTDRLLRGPGLLAPIGLLALVIGTAAAMNPLLALAGVGVAVLLMLVVLRADWLLLVLVAALPWEDALAFPTETVTVVKLLGALVMAGYAIRLLASDERLSLPSTTGWLAVFVLWVLVALMVSPDPAASIAQTLRYLLFAGFFFLFLQLVRTPSALRAGLRVLLASVALAALVAVTGFLTGESGLAQGPIGDPNDFAYLLATSLPLAGYLLLSDRGHRWLWAAATLVVIAALLATLSRGASVGLLAVAVWALLTRRVPLGGAMAVGSAIAAVIVLALTLWGPLIDERVQAKGKVADENVASRQALWTAALRMASDRPLTGVGPGRFGAEAPDYLVDDPIGLRDPVVHNSYLEILAELGLPALVAFVAFLVGSWRLARDALRRSELAGDVDGRRLALSLQASLVVAVVSGCFISAQVLIPLWLLAALAGVVAASRPAPAAAAVGGRAALVRS